MTSVKETTFGQLTEEDKKGHEEFKDDKEMYATYSKYYKREITPENNLKIIRFELEK